VGPLGYHKPSCIRLVTIEHWSDIWDETILKSIEGRVYNSKTQISRREEMFWWFLDFTPAQSPGVDLLNRAELRSAANCEPVTRLLCLRRSE
jgi:hypothetical protein